MPIYDFKCTNCGLIFEKFVRKKISSYECLSCGSDAGRDEVSAVGFVFGNGKTPGNTGVDSLDSSFDKFVGRDAEQRWESIKDRQTNKRKVQRDHGGVGKVPLRKNIKTGEYEPMRHDDVPKFQGLHKTYADMYEEHKKKRKGMGEDKFRKDDPISKRKNQILKQQLRRDTKNNNDL